MIILIPPTYILVRTETPRTFNSVYALRFSPNRITEILALMSLTTMLASTLSMVLAGSLRQRWVLKELNKVRWFYLEVELSSYKYMYL